MWLSPSHGIFSVEYATHAFVELAIFEQVDLHCLFANSMFSICNIYILHIYILEAMLVCRYIFSSSDIYWNCQ